jgi:hypothetical protein
MNRLSFFLAAQCALAAILDPCARVCEEFSAARHGNGHDLCENGGTSNCYHNAEIDEYVCSYLYWSDDTRGGLFYEPHVFTLTNAERSSRLTCTDAEIIVLGPQPTNNLNMALHMFVNSAPVQRRLAGGINNETLGIWPALHQFANNETTVSAQLAHECVRDDLSHVGEAFLHIMQRADMPESFAPNLARRFTCDGCGTASYTTRNGPIPVNLLGDAGSADLAGILRALVQNSSGRTRRTCWICDEYDESFTISPYFLNFPSEMLTFAIMPFHGNLSLPLLLNPSEIFAEGSSAIPMYRLYGYATSNNAATIRINDEWFVSNNGETLTLTSPITEAVVLDAVNFVIYERVI